MDKKMKSKRVTEKFIIENHTNISDYVIMKRVTKIIDMGLLSNNNTQYCYATRFVGCFIEMIKKNYGYKILILGDKEDEK